MHRNNHNLNIIVSRTETRIGGMIRSVTGGEYNHCSFCIDGDFGNIYGFSRRYREFWFTGCFTRENAIYFEDYRIYEVPLSREQYEALDERIVDMRSHIRLYNYLSALMLPAGVAVESEDSFTCSTFVADLIDKYTDIDPEKEVNLHVPMDILELMEKHICKGNARLLDITLPHDVEYGFMDPVTHWSHPAIPVSDHASDCEIHPRRAVLTGDIYDSTGRISSLAAEVINGVRENGWEISAEPIDADAGWIKARRPDRIICCGADRVLSRCVDRIIGSGLDVPIALIPSGTTNDFARTVNIPTDIAKATQLACGSNVRRIDSGKLDGRSFVCIAGFGDVAQASHRTSPKTKKAIGYAAYLLSALQSISDMKEYDVSITIDGRKIRGRYLMMLVTNSHRAGGIKLWDKVSPDDGTLKVLLVKRVGVTNIHETVESYTGRQISIQNHSGHPIEWVLDGEPGGSTREGEVSHIEVNAMSYSMVAGE